MHRPLLMLFMLLEHPFPTAGGLLMALCNHAASQFVTKEFCSLVINMFMESIFRYPKQSFSTIACDFYYQCPTWTYLLFSFLKIIIQVFS